MPEITNHGKLFFLIKTVRGWWVTGHGFRAHGNEALQPVSIAREEIRLNSGRRTEHLVAVDVYPVPMTGRRFFAVRRDDGSATGRQTQDQAPIGRDTRHATAHRMGAAWRGIFG